MNESMTVQVDPYLLNFPVSQPDTTKTIAMNRSGVHCSPLAGDRPSAGLRPITASEPSKLSGTLANALVRAYEGMEDLCLNENARRVLACLIRYGLDLKNYKAKVFIKKTTVANKLNLNEATVYRALNTLENADLIVRDEQLKFKSISTITFTEQALTRLGLTKTDEPNEAGILKGSDQKNDIVTLAPPQGVNSKPIQSFSKRQSQRDDMTKFGAQSVPTDLAWLINDKGLVPSAVFALMGIAKKKGHRLSDVVAHAASALRDTKIKNLFAYIRALVGKKIDYAFLAQQALEDLKQRAAASEKSEQRSKAVSAMAALVGTTFEAPDGKRWTVEEGVFVTTARGIRSAIPYSQAPSIVAALATAAWPIAHVNDADCLSSNSPKPDAGVSRACVREVLALLRRSIL